MVEKIGEHDTKQVVCQIVDNRLHCTLKKTDGEIITLENTSLINMYNVKARDQFVSHYHFWIDFVDVPVHKCAVYKEPDGRYGMTCKGK